TKTDIARPTKTTSTCGTAAARKTSASQIATKAALLNKIVRTCGRCFIGAERAATTAVPPGGFNGIRAPAHFLPPPHVIDFGAVRPLANRMWGFSSRESLQCRLPKL